MESILKHPTLLDLQTNDVLANISYVGASTSDPLIATLTTRFGITTNILFGNVEILQETPVGNLIVVLSGEPGRRDKALAYLQSKNVKVTLIHHHQRVIPLKKEHYIV